MTDLKGLSHIWQPMTDPPHLHASYTSLGLPPPPIQETPGLSHLTATAHLACLPQCEPCSIPLCRWPILPHPNLFSQQSLFTSLSSHFYVKKTRLCKLCLVRPSTFITRIGREPPTPFPLALKQGRWTLSALSPPRLTSWFLLLCVTAKSPMPFFSVRTLTVSFPISNPTPTHEHSLLTHVH